MRPRHNPGSKYKPINYARSLLVGPSQKRAITHWRGKEKVTLNLGLGEKGEKELAATPESRQCFPEAPG